MQDPNLQAASQDNQELKQAEGQEVAAAESAAQDNAMEATTSEEVTEG